MSASLAVELCPGSEAYQRHATTLVALLAADRLGANPWTRVGQYEFRAAPSGEGWEAKACWGRYVYAVPVASERDAVALVLGLACFTSRSAGRGKRSDIRIQWRNR